MSSFQVFARAMAGLTTVLGAVLLVSPESIITLFGMEQAVAASVLGRRAAMLFAGYAAMLWSVSSAPHSVARQAILRGIATFMCGLACAGVFEFVRGTAKSWLIVAASVVETVWLGWALLLLKKYSKLDKIE
jgi:hypothetical protein